MPLPSVRWYLLSPRESSSQDCRVQGSAPNLHSSSLSSHPAGEERGQLYKQYAGQHANYRGFFFTRAFSGATRLLGDGQVVLDPRSFRRENPALDHWGDDVNETGSDAAPSARSRGITEPCSPPTEDEIHLLPPSLHGFSLRIKRWGEFLISHLSPIEWRNESFAHLVIPNSYRRIIKALVTVHAGDLKDQLMKDVVEGKGTGLVMALHGSPGTGKTLTAEAVAEHLRKPLYVVSAGELGTTAAILEKQLTSVFRLATTWSAVLLIDEADIFLTKRDPRHLERNALVGIFLRQLEYFSGVLILTTNFIDQFDEAFLSRFAVVLQFHELDQNSRKMLWERFLLKATDSSDLSLFDLAVLSSHLLNGRDIKHAVQTAQAVALVEGEPLQMSHLEEVLSVARSGLQRS
ncbi:P-loop containing nucleoside triphosphate hydrolase protein [Leucosporidium creatinivorum]|uniref:p-loop containing nucleoside triphosphate hydrolase protein n=1 Tax=Leucosporidium creatinivorum TaxID=106004 RepID=A0A1Y2FRP7_9BASI|nr:P-loop containing nucleoside triphosphate hydrolase protein [Leucosporidium creatinivorum]